MKFPEVRAAARPAIHVETLLLLGAIFLMLAGNGSFWRAALADRPAGEPATWLFAAAVFTAFTAFYFAAAALVANRHTAKPLLTVLFMISAAAAYYMNRYSVYFDRAMLRNVFATNYKEASELLGWDLLLYLLAFGVLPSALVWWTQLKRRPLRRAVLVRLAWVGLAVVTGVASLLLVFADFASLMRNHREVRHLLTPGNLVAASAANAWGRAKRPNQPKIPVGADARLGAAWQGRTRPALFVLVIGETARAQNFALNGYARPTNPRLSGLDVINFPHAQACGTSTEVSLPCMFSPFGRRNYDEENIQTHESLLHVLARAGFKVLWRDNQSGCKGVCDGLPSEQLDQAKVAALCGEGQCLDEVLLDGMEGIARDTRGNLFVVMHQLGSHGPAYFKRYPAVFKRFTPACETEDLRHCTQAEIVNAYDNSLLYTDFVLGKIDRLPGQGPGDARHGHVVCVGPRRIAGRGRPVPARRAVFHRAGSAAERAFRRVAVAGVPAGFPGGAEVPARARVAAGRPRQPVPFAARRAGRPDHSLRRGDGYFRPLPRALNGGNNTLTSRPPPGASSRVTCAPCRCATARTMARPSPLPLGTAEPGDR